MDEFAQTRQPDGLFDDDFTPIIIEPISKKGNPPSYQSPREHPKARPTAPKSFVKASDTNGVAPTADLIPKPPAAVRGDRSATGGINKPKLTETELSARLEQAKRNNARREEAHRLAEADEASFQEREAQASEKRRQEGAARKAMEVEREKNRLRKLGAQAGREWDEGKEDQSTSLPRGSQYRRGAHGGVLSGGGGLQDGNGDYAPRYPRSQDDLGRTNFVQRGGRGRGERSRGERGRGRRGGRGRGSDMRGGSGPQTHANQSSPPNIGVEKDFPSLPPSISPMSKTHPNITMPSAPKPAPTSQTVPISKSLTVKTPKTLFGSKSHPSTTTSSEAGSHKAGSSNAGSYKAGSSNAGSYKAGTPKTSPKPRSSSKGSTTSPQTNPASSRTSNVKPIDANLINTNMNYVNTTAAPAVAPANPRLGLDGASSPALVKQSWADQVEDKERKTGK